MGEGGYVGRFAPSPTGRLHMGSLLAALASWCDARHRGGRWLVRMEDLDPPREVPGAASDILRTLEGFGLHWDGEVMYQSRRDEAYRLALHRLVEEGQAYGCICTRKALEGHAIYPGHCRLGLPDGVEPRSHRFHLRPDTVEWEDVVQGPQAFKGAELGDFVLRRADGFWAYQLAVVVDDIEQGVNAIIRGGDLLDSTPGQIALRSALAPDFPTVRWGHVPTLVNGDGQKLSKQTLARPVELHDESRVLHRLMAMLGQWDSDSLAQEAAERAATSIPASWLEWALTHWNPNRIPPGNIHWQGSAQG